MADERYKDKDWLQEKYHDEKMTQEEIGELCDITQAGVKYWMKKLGVNTRITGPQRFPHASFGMSNGYERWKGNYHKKEQATVHRLAAVAWFGFDAVKDKHVHHKNGIPWDNRKCNLEPISPEKHNTIHHKGKEINDAQLEGLKIGWYMNGHNTD